MAMYCPVCLNNSLHLSMRGVVTINVNGLQRDNGRFLFNLEKQKKSEIVTDFHKKLEEFFTWYGQFQNKEPIHYLHIFSSDFKCSEGCIIGSQHKFSVVDILLPKAEILKSLDQLGKQYNMKIELKND